MKLVVQSILKCFLLFLSPHEPAGSKRVALPGSFCGLLQSSIHIRHCRVSLPLGRAINLQTCVIPSVMTSARASGCGLRVLISWCAAMDKGTVYTHRHVPHASHLYTPPGQISTSHQLTAEGLLLLPAAAAAAAAAALLLLLLLLLLLCLWFSCWPSWLCLGSLRQRQGQNCRQCLPGSVQCSKFHARHVTVRTFSLPETQAEQAIEAASQSVAPH